MKYNFYATFVTILIASCVSALHIPANHQGRSLDSLGGANILRGLDSLGGGNILRQLDSLGGGNILRRDLAHYYYNNNDNNKRSYDPMSGMAFGVSKKNFDEIDRAGFGRFVKKNFDEIDRAGFGRFVKKNFDEIDRAGFGDLVKKSSSYGNSK